MEDVSECITVDSECMSINTQYPNFQVLPPSPHDIVKQESSTLIVAALDDDTCTTENIQAFLARWPPSITPVKYCNWIALDRGHHRLPVRDIGGLKTSFNSLVTTGSVSPEAIDDISRKHGVLSGKWLVYADPQDVDALWADVVRVVCLGLRRGSLKVSPRQEGEPHVICVYADDYTDEGEVGIVREALRAAGVTWKIGFKPDAYTYLSIYKKNPWNIRPSRYHS